jgi:hypothetical protein
MKQLRRLLQAADDLRRLRGLAWLFILGGGLLLAGLAWALLQWLGGWYVARQLSRARRLWPRSLAPPPLGRPDERALEGLAKQEERLPDQRVEVSFGDTDDGAGRLDRSG